MILLDTNILLRIVDIPSADCQTARRAFRTLRRKETLAIARQTLYEFWAVATRPPGKPPLGANGLGLSAKRADQWLNLFLRTLTLLPEPDDLPNRWRNLVRTYNITGIKSHDARLAAAAQAHNVPTLLTFNPKDFQRFPFLQLLDPHTI